VAKQKSGHSDPSKCRQKYRGWQIEALNKRAFCYETAASQTPEGAELLQVAKGLRDFESKLKADPAYELPADQAEQLELPLRIFV
jgi:hypothetical protein